MLVFKTMYLGIETLLHSYYKYLVQYWTFLSMNHIALHWLFRVIRARLQPPIKANDMPGKDLLKKVVVINKKGGKPLRERF